MFFHRRRTTSWTQLLAVTFLPWRRNGLDMHEVPRRSMWIFMFIFLGWCFVSFLVLLKTMPSIGATMQQFTWWRWSRIVPCLFLWLTQAAANPPKFWRVSAILLWSSHSPDPASNSVAAIWKGGELISGLNIGRCLKFFHQGLVVLIPPRRMHGCYRKDECYIYCSAVDENSVVFCVIYINIPINNIGLFVSTWRAIWVQPRSWNSWAAASSMT